MNQLLITPVQDGRDRLQWLSLHEKVEVKFLPFDEPVKIGNYTVVARPDVAPSLMTNTTLAPTQLYHLLLGCLALPVKARALNPDFFMGWREMADLCRMKGSITLLLLTDQDKIVLFTFRTTDAEVLAYEFTEPHLYNAGMLLRKQDIVEQWTKAYQARIEHLNLGFDADQTHVVVDLDEA